MAMPRRLPVPRGFRGARALPALLLGVLLAAATCRVQSAMYFAFAAPARAGPRLSLGSAAAPTGWGHTAAAPLPPAASPVARRVFGLGTSEILVILAIGALVLGPDALKNVAKEAGKAASDLKDVPDAFQEGMNQGKKPESKEEPEKMLKEPEAAAGKKAADDKAAEKA